MEFTLQVDGGDLAATLTLPEHPRAGVVVLHGAEAGERSYFLYEHLATMLASQDVAVLRFDRRPSVDCHDVPLALQASDARAAIGRLRDLVGAAPVGGTTRVDDTSVFGPTAAVGGNATVGGTAARVDTTALPRAAHARGTAPRAGTATAPRAPPPGCSATRSASAQRWAKTSDSSSEFEASRFAPCTPVHATSPTAQSPGNDVRPSRSVATPPIQ